MKCVVGLGNPGKRYAQTRHNVGFMVIDALAKSVNVRFKKHPKWNAEIAQAPGLLLVKPLTFMNLSGQAVKPIVDFYRLDEEDVCVIYDELALPPQHVRFRPFGGAGGHNGMKSIIASLGTQDVKRARIGIGEAPPMMAASDYVLQPFPKAEINALNDVIERTKEALSQWLKGETFENVMTHYNEKAATPLT